MTNDEIFNQFESNKRLLLFLIKEKIIQFDENICLKIEVKKEKNGIKYSNYFLPEMNKPLKKSEEENDENLMNFYEYEEKRQEGENDSYICSLIRKDSVEEFVSYVNRSHLSLSIEIKPSIFETNSFLNSHNPILIEYASFFGSIKIF